MASIDSSIESAAARYVEAAKAARKAYVEAMTIPVWPLVPHIMAFNRQKVTAKESESAWHNLRNVIDSAISQGKV